MLARYYAARTRDPFLAEDIVQELYLKISSLDPGYAVENPTAFLFRTAQNIWLNKIRSETRAKARDEQWRDSQQSALGNDVIVDSPSAEMQIAARQELALLRETVEDLPDKTREIFKLHKFQGLSQADVAATLDISKSSVEKHVSAAMKFLLARLRAD